MTLQWCTAATSALHLPSSIMTGSKMQQQSVGQFCHLLDIYSKSETVTGVALSFDTHHVWLDPLAIFRAPLINILPGLIRANKADRLDGWMVTDEIHSCGRKTVMEYINLNILSGASVVTSCLYSVSSTVWPCITQGIMQSPSNDKLIISKELEIQSYLTCTGS